MKKLVTYLLACFLLVLIPTTLCDDTEPMYIDIEWYSTAFKNEERYDIVEDSDKSNVVTARVMYGNNSADNFAGYDTGELIITVKGIGGVGLNYKMRADVGADAASSTVKKYDFSYTYNYITDVYTFTNNKPIPANSRLSGFFDITWTLPSLKTRTNYSQSDVVAKLINNDGSVIETEPLIFTNKTFVHQYSAKVYTTTLYNNYGFNAYLSEPNKYWITLQHFDLNMSAKSRDILNKETYIDFDPDGLTDDCLILNSNITMQKVSDDKYKVYSDLLHDPENDTYWAYVAYRYDDVAGKTIKPTLTFSGNFIDGDDYGNTDMAVLAESFVPIAVPPTYVFPEVPGDIYDFEHTTFECDYRVLGQYLLDGVSKNFYSTCELRVPVGTSDWSFNIVHDAFCITKNSGTLRFLDKDEYEISKIVLPASKDVYNFVKFPVDVTQLDVNVYAAQNGEAIKYTDEQFVQHYTFQERAGVVNLPENTTSVAVTVGNVDVDIASFSVQSVVEFKCKDSEDENEKLNLATGYLTSNAFLDLFYEGNKYNSTDSAWYEDQAEVIDFETHDLEMYGDYLDRESTDVQFYERIASVAEPLTMLTKPVYENNQYSLEYEGRLQLDYNKPDTPSRFSAGIVLPQHTFMEGYNLVEDLPNVLNMSSVSGGMSSEFLWEHCTYDVIQDAEGTDCDVIKLYFDFGDSISDEMYIDISLRLGLGLDVIYSDSVSSGLTAYTLLIPKDMAMYQFDDKQVFDDGLWFTQDPGKFDDFFNTGQSGGVIGCDQESTYQSSVQASQLELIKYVSTSSHPVNQVGDETNLQEAGKEYSYTLSLRTSYQILTDVIFEDVLEDEEGSQWKGTLQSIQLPDGINGTIYYKTSESAEWSTDVKPEDAIAFKVDLGSHLISPGSKFYVRVNMKAPEDASLYDKLTHNSFSFNCTYIDAKTGATLFGETLKSNKTTVALSPALKNLIVRKKDATDLSSLSGATYSLCLNKDDSVLQTKTTDARGQIVFKDLRSDTEYYLVEQVSPYGYVLSEEKVPVVFTDENTVYLDVLNERKKGSAKVVKTNELDSTYFVQGATYGIFNYDDSMVESRTTDANGSVVFSDLEWGTYTIKETEAPVGFKLNETVYTVTIDRESVSTEQLVETSDTQEDILVTLTKRAGKLDGDPESVNELKLANSVFELKRVKDGNEIYLGRYVTDSNGVLQLGPDLVYGDYTIREVRAPLGYYLDTTTKTFTLTPTVREIEIEFVNNRRQPVINIYKVDDKGEALVGAKVELFDEDKTTSLGVYEFDEMGFCDITLDFWGTVYVKEVRAPQGYELDDTLHEVVVNAQNMRVDLIIENKRTLGSVKLTKTDLDGSNKLEGAVYSLYSNDGVVIAEGLTTDANGEILYEGLDWGTYYFKETEAPLGYSLSDELIRFSVNALTTGVTQEVTARDDVSTRSIQITKRIKNSDANFENGKPTFVYELTGTDINGQEHSYCETVTFTKEFADNNVGIDGYVQQSINFAGLIAGDYKVVELTTSRYEISDVTAINGVVTDTEIDFDLVNNLTCSGTYTNDKFENQDFSDTQLVTNMLKSSSKLTGINAIWTGQDDVTAGGTIDTSKIEVFAMYDDGTTVPIDISKCSLSTTEFSKYNGEYTFTVTYSENGRVYSKDFQYLIDDGKDGIVALSAEYINDELPLEQGSEIPPEVFRVTATYNNGESRVLGNTEFAPTYELNYHASEDRLLANKIVDYRKYSNVTAINLTFSTYSPSDDFRMLIKDSEGNILLDLTNESLVSLLGSTVTLDSAYLYFDDLTNGKGLGVLMSVAPVYEPLVEFEITDNVVPNKSGDFDVTIKLKDDLFEEDVSCVATAEADRTRLETWYYDDRTVVLYDDYSMDYTPFVNYRIEKYDNFTPWSSYKTTLKSLNIYEGITYLRENAAFMRFSNLRVVNFPESLIKIPDNAFTYCTSLEEITLRMPLFSGSSGYCFSNCTSLSKVTLTGDSGYIVNGMFSKCSSLSEIEFPVGTTKIGSYAFDSCTSLKTINLPNSLTSLGNYVFKNCNNITEINLSDSLSNLGWGCFYGCSKITSIELPELLESLPDSSFDKCKMLKNISFGPNVKSFGDDCFEDCSVLELDSIPRSVETIGNYCFADCDALTDLTIPNTVKSIGSYCFESCGNLVNVTIEDGTELILGERCFRYTLNGGTLTLGEGITSLPKNSLYESYMYYLVLPDSLISIEEGAFAYVSLREFNVPANVETIDSLPSKSYLTAITVDPENTVFDSRGNCNCLVRTQDNFVLLTCGNSTLVEGMEHLGDYCFQYFNGSTVTLPSTLKSIGYGAFMCSSICSVQIPEGVTNIGDYCFNDSPVLSEVYIPSTVEHIGTGAFSSRINTTFSVSDANNYYYSENNCLIQKEDCKVIRVGTYEGLPSGIKIIGLNAFSDVKNVGDLVLPDSVDSIEPYAFTDCKSLKSIVLPDDLIIVPDSCFYGCSNLTAIIIPDSVQSIGASCFQSCASLQNITLPNNLLSLGKNCFWSCSELLSLTIPEGVTVVPEYLCNNCSNLVSVVVNGNCITFEQWAFANCKKLQEINLPDSVESIGSYCFNNCNALSELTVPDNVATIGSQAFYKVPHVTYNGTATGSPWGAVSIN